MLLPMQQTRGSGCNNLRHIDVQRYALAPGLSPDTEHPVFRCKLHISVGDRGVAADMRQLRQLLSHVGIGVHLFPVKASAGIRIIAARHVFVS